MHPWLKILLGALCGGMVPIAAILTPTLATGAHPEYKWLLIVYFASCISSGWLYSRHSPAGRTQWTEEERAAFLAKQP